MDLGGSSGTCLKDAFPFPQESQVLLTLTNPVENLTHVTLLEYEEGDPDDINSTAKVRTLCLILSNPDFSWSGFICPGLKDSTLPHFHIQTVIKFF